MLVVSLSLKQRFCMLIGLSLPFLSLICIADEPDDVFNQSNPCNHIHTTNKTIFFTSQTSALAGIL